MVIPIWMTVELEWMLIEKNRLLNRPLKLPN